MISKLQDRKKKKNKDKIKEKAIIDVAPLDEVDHQIPVKEKKVKKEKVKPETQEVAEEEAPAAFGDQTFEV